MLGKQGLMEQCGQAISYLSYDSLKRREERRRERRERKREKKRERLLQFMKELAHKATNAILRLCCGSFVMEWCFIH